MLRAVETLLSVLDGLFVLKYCLCNTQGMHLSSR